MRFRFAIVIALFALAGVGAYPGSVAYPAGPAQISDLRPTIILVSIDGFRADYLDMYSPPTLNGLARQGVRAKWMIPSFPSKTFPNHYAIATGLYPQNNGIVENNIYDSRFDAVFTMGNREEVRNGRWWLGEPIWITAEKQGQVTAPFFFPGSEAEIGGRRPTHWKPYDGKVPNSDRVDSVLELLELPVQTRPTFLTVYFSDVDDAGHHSGPQSPETRDAVLRIDGEIERLITGLKLRRVFDKIDLIVLSDHGMATVDPHNVIVLDELFNVNLTQKVFWTPEIVSIFPKPGRDNFIYQDLKRELTAHATPYRRGEMPERFHYSNSLRIAPIIVLPDEGWMLMQRSRYEEMKARDDMTHLRGGHGYDNQLPSMRALFIAHGEAFEPGKVVEPFENVDVYNIMAAILRLRPAKNDGHPDTVKMVLKKSEGRSSK
jgi:predicted AlkP superfamily pyrophosphatase or phosphodiesterase